MQFKKNKRNQRKFNDLINIHKDNQMMDSMFKNIADRQELGEIWSNLKATDQLIQKSYQRINHQDKIFNQKCQKLFGMNIKELAKSETTKSKK